MTEPADLARSFGAVAASYDRGRPSYPREALTWALGTQPLRILELGAGTGKLTQVLVELGHDVFATEPDERMLDILSAALPDVRATVGTAEQIPAGDQQYDVVIAGQAFHWFDQEAALREISRVLAKGGRLVLLWNERDERIPWVRKLGRLMGSPPHDIDPTAVIDDSAMFSAVDAHDFRFWQVVNRDTVQDLVLSGADLAALSEEGREAKRTEVLDFYDDYGRGMDGMQVPYTCRVFRSVVLEHARPAPAPAEVSPIASSEAAETTSAATQRSMTDTAHRLPRVVTDGLDRLGARASGDGDDLLLIDFR